MSRLRGRIGAVKVVNDRKDAAADRDARFPGVAGVGPRFAKPLNLLGLQLVERDTSVLAQKRRAHQVHPLLGRPLGGLAGRGSPPDPFTQTFGVWLNP